MGSGCRCPDSRTTLSSRQASRRHSRPRKDLHCTSTGRTARPTHLLAGMLGEQRLQLAQHQPPGGHLLGAVVDARDGLPSAGSVPGGGGKQAYAPASEAHSSMKQDSGPGMQHPVLPHLSPAWLQPCRSSGQLCTACESRRGRHAAAPTCGGLVPGCRCPHGAACRPDRGIRGDPAGRMTGKLSNVPGGVKVLRRGWHGSHSVEGRVPAAPCKG